MKPASIFLISILLLTYSCKKECVISNLNEAQSASSFKFIYQNREVSRSAFDSNNPELVMLVSENNTVYVFDNNNEFKDWVGTTSYASDIEKLENKRNEILRFAEENDVIGVYERTGVLKAEYLSFIEKYKSASHNKTEVLSALYDLAGAAPGSSYYVIVIGWPYGTIGKMNDKASSISGITAVTVCYDKTWFSGSRVYISSSGATINFYDLGFDNKTSSVLSI
jgi:hypothetical protein